MGNEIENQIEKLDDLVKRFGYGIVLLVKEEDETNEMEVMEALKTVLRNLLDKIHTLIKTIKEEIVWSLLDDRKEMFKKIYINLKPSLCSYKGYVVDEEIRKIVIHIGLLFDEGQLGFRQSFVSDAYYEELFSKQLSRYQEENTSRLETIYDQDSSDRALKFTDENELKNAMVDERRRELFTSRFGKVYHDTGRNIILLTCHIIDQHETDLKDINVFFDHYAAYLIAKEHCHAPETEEETFNITIFKDNVDVNKVIRRLKAFIDDKTLSAQIHWYIVYKVFLTKDWLDKKCTQQNFRDQMNSVFGSVLKSTKDNFSKVDSYFKDKNYADWTLDDHEAPTCCGKYKRIADIFDREFQEPKYAKPGTMINTRNIEKFR